MASPARNDCSEPSLSDLLDLSGLVRRLASGARLTLALALLGLVIGAALHLATTGRRDASTAARVVFSFPGIERGEYPDKSKFHADDLRSPEIIVEALQRQQLDPQKWQSQIRASISIEGLIPATVVRERDQLRSGGLRLRPFVPDEYHITLNLPRRSPLTARQRELLLNEIFSVYREQFIRTYVTPPLDFGQAFAVLGDFDYPDYEALLRQENDRLAHHLEGLSRQTRNFRSPRTHLSFSELQAQNGLFRRLKLHETLGLLRHLGVSRNPDAALAKLAYRLDIAQQEERIAQDKLRLLGSLLERITPAPTAHHRGPGMDDKDFAPRHGPSHRDDDDTSSIARQATTTISTIGQLQTEIAGIEEWRKRITDFAKLPAEERNRAITRANESIAVLKAGYDEFMARVIATCEDFQRQSHADAIRVSMHPVTDGFYRGLTSAMSVGAALGLALGLAWALLRNPPRARR